MGMFTPQVSSDADAVAKIMQGISLGSLVVGIGLLPLLFVPLVHVPFLEGKVYLSVICLSVALLVAALSVLRVGTLSVPASFTLLAAWLWGIAVVVSAALSGDVSNSLTTLSGGVYTAVTILIGVFALTTASLVMQRQRAAQWLFGVLGMTSGAVLLWQALRLVSGYDLSFGFFPNQTSSVIGGWNDVAIVATGFVLMTLLVQAQGSLRTWQRWLNVVGLVAALFVMMVVNNPVLWGIVGVVALSIIVMAITRRNQEVTPQMIAASESQNGWLLSFAGVIFVATLIVFLGGDSLQRTLATATDSSFVEVRPTVSASLDIVRPVWAENALTGVGPARFSDAWRVNKAPGLNETIFWDARFTNSHNFVLTHAVETGLLGIGTWLLFIGAFLFSGVRTFVLAPIARRDTHFKQAVIAFVLALFVWTTFFIANPGVPLFILAMSVTGVYIGLSYQLRPRRLFAISLLQNQKLGFVVVASLVILVIAMVWCLQQLTEQVVAATQVNQVLTEATTESLDSTSERLAAAFALHRTDSIARTNALVQLTIMQQLFASPEPTNSEQQQFQQAAVGAVNAATVATSLDPTDPENWYAQVRVYALLAQTGVEGALERATAAIDEVDRLDPLSPQVPLVRAELALIVEDVATAREQLTEAVRRKSNFSPALYLLAQLEIAAGNVTEAIAVTESILSFEPDNPARWYQLGVLYQAAEEPETAIQALTQAIALDQDYANALYIRGLLLAQSGELSAATADMNRVLELNPDNELVSAQLQALSEGNVATSTDAVLEQIEDTSLLSDQQAVSEAAAESDLITTTTNAPVDDATSEGSASATSTESVE